MNKKRKGLELSKNEEIIRPPLNEQKWNFSGKLSHWLINRQEQNFQEISW